MNHLLFTLLDAVPATQGQQPSIAIVYFFMIRPQNKKQKEIQKFRNALQTGQNVITIGGIHGTIKTIDDTNNTVLLEVATGVKMTFEKSAIMPSGSTVAQR